MLCRVDPREDRPDTVLMPGFITLFLLLLFWLFSPDVM